MPRIVLGATPITLSLECGAIWGGCRWLCPAMTLIMLANSLCADEPATSDSQAAVPPSGVVIRLQLAPSAAAMAPEVAPEAEASPKAEVGVEAVADKTSAMSVQFRRQTGRLAPRGQSTNVPALRRAPPERIPPAPVATQPKASPTAAVMAGPKSLAQSTAQSPESPAGNSDKGFSEKSARKTADELSSRLVADAPAESEGKRTADARAASAKPLALELQPTLELSSRTGEATDKFQLLESSSEIEPSQWDLSLDAPDAVPSSRGADASSPATPGEVRTQLSDSSNERPLDSLAERAEVQLKPDDIPLLHEPHPFDAPADESVAPIVKRSALDAGVYSDRELRIEAGIARCLNYYVENPENTVRRGPWALMHAALPMGVEGEVLAGNRRVNTIGWLSFNGTSGKQHMFQPTRTGFRPNVGPGVQGHEGQFLAVLAQSKVRGDFPLQVNGRNYTVMDLARYEMSTCREKSELTFKLIGLSRYLEPDAQWRDNRGRPWSLEKLLVEEMAQPVNGAACGGVHRLMGLSYAIIERQAAGQPITGNWQRAQTYVNNYVQYTLTLQNSDGSFSTNWFESRGMDPSIERRVQTSGHILEWLVYTLPDEHLRSPEIQQGIEFLLGTIGREPQRDWPIGPRGHALRAMALYSQRIFGAEPGQLKSYIADVSQSATVR